MPRIKVSLSIGFVTANLKDEIDIDQAEWDECQNDEEREKLIDTYATEWANNYIEIGASVIEE